MAHSNGISLSSAATLSSSPSTSLRPLWLHALFGNDGIAAFDRVRVALNSGFANYAGTPPSSLNADITRLYRAIATNEETVVSLCQRQEDLMQESKTELHMKQELEWEVKRLQESLAFHLREIKNIEIREELRQFQLRELNDLGTVTLVQALREETPEEFRTEARNDEESLGGGGERSRNWES